MTPVIVNNELQIDLGTLHEQVTLTFNTVLDVNATNLPEGFRFDQSNTSSDAHALLKLTNTAVLGKAGRRASQPRDQAFEIANTAFDKSSVVHSDQYTVDYTIKINQAGADLSTVCPDGLVITDTMSEELLLDPDSVVLKQAEIQANGDFKETDTAEGTAVQVNGNQAVFMLPAALDLRFLCAGLSCFVNVAAKGEFALSNLAGMGDQSSGLANSDAIQFQSKYSAGSAMRIPGRASLELTKTAADDNTPVTGAEYGL